MDKIEQLFLSDVNDLQKVYTQFLQSHYYSKAIRDARYERLQAIKDFLLAQFPLETSRLEAIELDTLALYIRENYYRYF